jgi:Ca-activated chloride channel family protein
MSKFMSKFVCITGIIAIALLLLLLTGVADDREKISLRQGNKQYSSAMYGDALSSYEAALELNPESESLNFNAAQAAYLSGDYRKASLYYEKSPDHIDKYLNSGNIHYKIGRAQEDPAEKAQMYLQALEMYKTGMIKYPYDVPLKYNYEFVKSLVEEFLSEMEMAMAMEGGEEGEEEGEEGDGQEGSRGRGRERERYRDFNWDGPDPEALARILEWLESHEEESLKNNRDIERRRGAINGW